MSDKKRNKQKAKFLASLFFINGWTLMLIVSPGNLSIGG
jgi:hypothetical protein